MSETIVAVRGLSKHFVMKGGWGRPTRMLRAVDGVSFEIAASETLGLVGESGSGKSTTGRLLVGLLPATGGSVRLFGHEIADGARPGAIDPVRRRVQFVFQDPQGSLDPRMRVEAAIAEPLDVAGGLSRGDRADRVRELIGLVGLPRDCGERFPHEFSGDPDALALNPAFIVCDEPVSALDVSMQAQVVNLLLDLQDRLGLSYLFIAHDLAVVRNVSTRIAVMYAGSIVEIAPRRQLYATPRHPYTQALLASVPRPHPNRTRARTVAGELPSLLDPPPGCAFHTRCPYAFDRCRVERPLLRPLADGHLAACHLDAPAGAVIPIVAAA
jgi:oligopeptide/dipeptide ABC transporter ATP-binding protein